MKTAGIIIETTGQVVETSEKGRHLGWTQVGSLELKKNRSLLLRPAPPQ